MKRSPLKRTSSLKRTAFKPKRNSKKESDWAKARRHAMDRSSGRCHASIPAAACSGHAEHVHHIKRRSQGGNNELSNLLVCCFACHEWIHRNPEEATKKGFLFLNKGLQ